MYNNSANTTFIGKSIHFLPSCHSTNTVAGDLIRAQKAVNGLIVITNEQTAGRGQQGNRWISTANLNLTLSVIFFPLNTTIKDTFYLNIFTSLAVAKTAHFFLPHKSIKVKWPNDVYVIDKKISGILVENGIRGEKVNSTVIGIGLNVNEIIPLPTATSLLQELGDAIDLQIVLDRLSEDLEYFYLMFVNGEKKILFDLYKEHLFGLNTLLPFEDREGKFSGYIRGINEVGELQIEKESGSIQSYAFKQVTFLNHPNQ